MLNLRSAALLFAITLTSLGCHAQTTGVPTDGKPLPLATARRVEVLVRQKANLPPDSTITVGVAKPSDFSGYKTVSVIITNEGQSSHPIDFLLSDDGKTLAQLSKYDISANPRDAVSAEGRPFRGGPASAPVIIVGYDDLECPFCARLHATIFPAITDRYGDKVHIVYKDFPLPDDQHPWAMHAAVDVNCLGAQSGAGYWHVVDAIHAHASDLGKDLAAPAAKDGKEDKTVARADDQLDKLVQQEGVNDKIDISKLNACLAKQDKKAVEASRDQGTALGVNSTPTLFINGDKIDGAVPIEFIFGIIDDALRAENVVPPPPYATPKPLVPPAVHAQPTAPAK